MNTSQDYLNEKIIKLGDDILNYLKAQHQSVSSWEIKIHFKIPSSLLYMALGYLLSIGKINITSENLIYKIELNRVVEEPHSSNVKDTSH